MNKRIVIGVIVALAAVLVVWALYAPTTVDPNQDVHDISTPALPDNALATGGALSTGAAGIEAIMPSETAAAPGFRESERPGY